MTDLTINQNTARVMLLAAQGLVSPPERAAVKSDVLAAIRRMGVLQIDTIHVVARSPYLVLFSRLGSYNPAWLEETHAEGKLFEFWAHAACFLPTEDYALVPWRMAWFSQRYFKEAWVESHRETIDRVLEHIQTEGEVRSADFERTDGRKGAWWDWKEEKLVLEYLFLVGKLMVPRREKFQRIYNLRERVMPNWDAQDAVPLEEAYDELSVRAVRALGAVPARWVSDYYRLPKQGMPARLERLASAGRLLRVRVEDDKAAWYVHPENRALLDSAAAGAISPNYTTLLSPFDPLVWDRDRALTLFGFDYRIECYTPAPKRRYGYFSLPILHDGQLVGRLDAKAHRKDGIFEVRALHLEPAVSITDHLTASIREAVARCAAWHGAQQVVIRRSDPAEFAASLSPEGAYPVEVTQAGAEESQDLY